MNRLPVTVLSGRLRAGRTIGTKTGPKLVRDVAATAGEIGRTTEALQLARRICEQRGLRLTPLREGVLAAIAASDRPLGAYQLLSLLHETIGRRVGPPTVYRAIDFLLAARLISRVETRNAYVLREQPERESLSVLFLCDLCDTTVTVDHLSLEELIKTNAATVGFKVGKSIIECGGTCSACIGKDPVIDHRTSRER
jgi:Fur family zinc uptake transcriptional regulator